MPIAVAPDVVESPSKALLIYDGECPLCRSYVRYLRVRESVGEIELVNARDRDARVETVRLRGFDLDQGMVLMYGGRYYHGAECVHMLALLSTRSGAFNRINAAVFKRPALAKLLYPVLRTGRSILLRLLNKPQLENHGSSLADSPERSESTHAKHDG